MPTEHVMDFVDRVLASYAHPVAVTAEILSKNIEINYNFLPYVQIQNHFDSIPYFIEALTATFVFVEIIPSILVNTAYSIN